MTIAYKKCALSIIAEILQIIYNFIILTLQRSTTESIWLISDLFRFLQVTLKDVDIPCQN